MHKNKPKMNKVSSVIVTFVANFLWFFSKKWSCVMRICTICNLLGDNFYLLSSGSQQCPLCIFFCYSTFITAFIVSCFHFLFNICMIFCFRVWIGIFKLICRLTSISWLLCLLFHFLLFNMRWDTDICYWFLFQKIVKLLLDVLDDFAIRMCDLNVCYMWLNNFHHSLQLLNKILVNFSLKVKWLLNLQLWSTSSLDEY